MSASDNKSAACQEISWFIHVIASHILQFPTKNGFPRVLEIEIAWRNTRRSPRDLWYLVNRDRDMNSINFIDTTTTLNCSTLSLPHRAITELRWSVNKKVKNVGWREKSIFLAQIFDCFKSITKPIAAPYRPIFRSSVDPCPSSPRTRRGSGWGDPLRCSRKPFFTNFDWLR